MYSFQYDEGETWAAWPTDVSLSEFNEGNSAIVIWQIFQQLFDGVRDQMDELKEAIQNRKAELTNKMSVVLTTFEDYRQEAKTNEAFAR